MKSAITIILFVLVLSVRGNPRSRISDYFGGPEICDIIAKAERVEVRNLTFLGTLEAGAAPIRNPLLYSLKNIRFREGPWIEVSSDQASELARHILSDATYPRDWAGKSGSYLPQLQLRFSRQGQRIDLFLSFTRDAMSVRINDEEVFGRDFDGASDELFEIMLKVLPNDAQMLRIAAERNKPDLRKIREERRRQIRANQTLEPTTLLVMPRAGARVTPSRVVAHL